MKFISAKRAIWAASISLVIVVYCFNFIPIYADIIVTRSIIRQIADYLLNIGVFFIAIYPTIWISDYLVSFYSRKKPRKK